MKITKEYIEREFIPSIGAIHITIDKDHYLSIYYEDNYYSAIIEMKNQAIDDKFFKFDTFDKNIMIDFLFKYRKYLKN